MAGTLAGLAGAGTFIPYRNASTFNPALAEIFTGIAAAGAIVSVVGVLGGWGLLRARAWAWNTTMAAAVGSVAVNAAITTLWQEYTPFLVMVAVVYGLEGFLLLVSWKSFRPSTSRLRPSGRTRPSPGR